MEKTKFELAVIDFLQKYFSKHGKAPSTATLFRSFNKTMFYEVFPEGLAQACKAAGIPVPEERLKRTRKALRAAVEKREDASPSLDLTQSIQTKQREEQRIIELIPKRIEELVMLAQDPNEAISRLVLDTSGKTFFPIFLKKKHGVEATVPEILEMLKQYKKAVDEGWSQDFMTEWGLLSEEEQEAFREFCNKAYSEVRARPTRYLAALRGEVDSLKKEKDELLKEIAESSKKKKDLDWKCLLLEAGCEGLEKDHEERKKRLDNEYDEKERDHASRFSMNKRQKEDEINELTNKLDRLKTECYFAEKRLTSIKAEATEAEKQRDTARDELERLRAEVGPEGTVTDLVRQNEDLVRQNKALKQDRKDKERQLQEKAVEVSGKWLSQEEAFLTLNEERKLFMGKVIEACRFCTDEVERRIENAGLALRVLEFLESELPDDKFRELVFVVELAEVKRESLNPDNPYFADLPARKKELLGVFPTPEEYQRLHNEKMRNLHECREAILQKIREAAGDVAMMQTVSNIGDLLLSNFVKPVVEAYLNPEKSRPQRAR